MVTDQPRTRRTLPSRAKSFAFSTLSTIRERLLRRAGALTRPGGYLPLTVDVSDVAREEFERVAEQLLAAA